MARFHEREHNRAVAELLHGAQDELLAGIEAEGLGPAGGRPGELPRVVLRELQRRLQGATDELHAAPHTAKARPTWSDSTALTSLLRELALLRSAIVALCERHEQPLRGRTAQLVHAAIDEAVLEATRVSEQSALREVDDGHARIEALFTQAPCAVALLEGPEHRFVFANARYKALVGPHEPVGRPLLEVLPQLAHEQVPALLAQVYATGTVLEGHELSLSLERAGSTSEALFAFTYAPYRDPSGTITGIAVFANDITREGHARRHAESVAAEFSAIIQSLPDAVYVGDANGIRYGNKSAYARLGFADLSQLRRPHVELLSMLDVRSLKTGAPVPAEESGFLRALAGESSVCELIVRNARSGESLVVRATYAPVLQGEQVVAAVAVHTDITDQKRMEDRRDRLHALEQRARQEAEAANRIKDDFIATVSHELRTPLSAILGWARLLGAGHLSPEKQLQAIQVIERNAKAQAQLIEDLLDVSRILSGKLRLEVTLLEPLDVVEAALDVVRSTAEAKGVKLESILDPQAGPLMGDPDRLQQVFWNLLTNAVKFTPKGGRIQVRLLRNGSHVELVVEDNGQGIKTDFLPFVFEKFRQAESAANKTHRGLGLGLSIVKYLVEAHGGTIRALSEGEGRGAQFIVQLPLSPVRHSPTAISAETRSSLPPVLDCPPALAGLRVLVVDDEEDARSLLATVLDQCRARVHTAHDVASGFALFKQTRPDVVVSDIGMPGATGYELVRAIRALPVSEGGATPAVALTAYARSEDRMRALAAGFTMHVPKPIEPAELMVVIASVVARKQ